MIRLETKARNPKGAAAVLDGAIKRQLLYLGALGQREAKLGSPANTGQLRNSILLTKEFVASPFAVEVGTNLPYALVMEDGRRPGRFPPVLAIFRWVWLKRRVFDIGRGRNATAKAKQVAFLIARKIAREGIKGRKFFEAASLEVQKAIGRSAESIGVEVKKAWDNGR